MREGYKVVALLLKTSLGLFGLVGRRRVLLPHPGSAIGYLIVPGDHHTLQHIQVHFGVVSSEGHIMPPHIFEVCLKVNTKVYLNVLKSVVIPWCNQVAGSRP